VPVSTLGTFLSVLEVLRPAFTPAAFARFVALCAGWLLTPGRHSTSACLLWLGLADACDHTAFYRFFSRGTWDPDVLGRLVFEAARRWLPPGAPLRLVVDDTLCHPKGPHVFGLGNHLDAVRSTKRTKVFAFGHVWVVLALVVRVPFARRSFALPLLFRLHRNEKECARHGAAYRPKTVLARELVECVLRWTEGAAERLALFVDNGYANATVLGDLPERVTAVGALRPDAALHAPAEPGVPLRRLPSPGELSDDVSSPWRTTAAELYGREAEVAFKTCVARWRRGTGERLLRLVVVRCTGGALPVRVFFATDPTWDARAVLEGYADGRWPIEPCFRDCKQLLGLDEASVRAEAAVRRMVPFVGLLASLLVLWALEGGLPVIVAAQPVRRWYRHKVDVSFEDLVWGARKCLQTGDVRALLAEREAAAEARGQPLPRARPRPPRDAVAA
jgi:hypothetical protein